MIPSYDEELLDEIEFETEPSKNYKLNSSTHSISGYCDGLEAMKQVCYKILNTERYEHIIYSWDYGIETKDLYGEEMEYVVPELERRISEALTQDDRINSVDSFEFETSKKGSVLVSFIVQTTLGEVEADLEVDY